MPCLRASRQPRLRQRPPGARADPHRLALLVRALRRLCGSGAADDAVDRRGDHPAPRRADRLRHPLSGAARRAAVPVAGRHLRRDLDCPAPGPPGDHTLGLPLSSGRMTRVAPGAFCLAYVPVLAWVSLVATPAYVHLPWL